jgi:hypothetical protein
MTRSTSSIESLLFLYEYRMKAIESYVKFRANQKTKAGGK